jgi:hypothetical protein
MPVCIVNTYIVLHQRLARIAGDICEVLVLKKPYRLGLAVNAWMGFRAWSKSVLCSRKTYSLLPICCFLFCVHYLFVFICCVQYLFVFFSPVFINSLLFSLLCPLPVCYFLSRVHYLSVVFSPVSITCLLFPLLCTLPSCCFLVNIIHQMVTLNLSCLSKREEGQLSKLADYKWRLIDFVRKTLSLGCYIFWDNPSDNWKSAFYLTQF